MAAPGRGRAQGALRVAGLVFVVAWLLSGALQSAVPFWLPFAILAASELEFLARGRRESRAPRAAGARASALERRLPGAPDADLGWVEATGDDGETMLVAAASAARRRSWALPLLVAAAALALLAAAYRADRRLSWSSLAPAQRLRAEQRFTREASLVAGRPVRVRCDEDYVFTGVGSDAAGVAFPRRGLAFLEPGICRTLRRLAFEGATRAGADAGWAVVVLAHEAVHLRGELDEARAECFALQEGVRLATRLGVEPARARALMRRQLDRALSDTSVQRLDYRLPAECRNDGGLDLRPADPSFP